ncbi:NAD(P)H-binding protein [Fundicoccus culcitae]|uniref:NAD(P)H-binding protein n=1 Tax=Fundicoccus culcitae TaxID=2969821 RepID=A0ABY5P252_9LACT|nr:NAD(P)H-binding protein [Fundicoccus culcitae]UUX32783.1 NAD(P)H-binding protein [Fundicoccus culcitae]
MKNILILGAGGQIPRFLMPLLQEQMDLNITLFGRNAERLPYENVVKISGDASNPSDLEPAIKGQDVVYMNFDSKSVTQVVVDVMNKTGVKRILQAGVLSVYGEVAEPFASWNSRMMGGSVARNRGNEVLEASDLDYTYMRMTWLYNGKRDDYVASPKGEPFLGAQITRQAIAQYILDNIIGKRNDVKESIGLWEPGSEYKAKPDFY